MVKKFIGRILCVLIAVVVMVVAPTSAYALSEEQLDMFAQNDILFYDPSGSDAKSFCDSGDCYIVGSTRDEKLWSGLRHVGFTPEQAAGIIGNIVHEGGSPARQEGAYNIARNKGCLTQEGKEYDIYLDQTNGAHHAACMQNIYSEYEAGENVVGIGLGFVQWTSHGRRLGYLAVMEELGLLKYFEGDAYKTYGSVSDDKLKELITNETGFENDYWALWCAAIKFIWTEMNGSYKKFFEQSSVEEYAGYTASVYEACSGCKKGQDSYKARVASAKEYYQKYLNGDFDSVENTGTGNATSNTIGATGNCSVPNNITNDEDVIKVMQQFIMDTNKMYGTNYTLPNSIGELKGTYRYIDPFTPNNDDPVKINNSVKKDWISRGIISDKDVLSLCWGGSNCGQCTALSGWFVATMTDYIYGGGWGDAVVANLAAKNPDIKVTNEPEVFSVFSETYNGLRHTGVVIGEYSDGSYLTIENNIGRGTFGTGYKLAVRKLTAETMKKRGFTFAVVSDKLKLNHIGQE